MMYLSRLTLSRDPSIEALKGLFNPEQEGARIDAHHRLIWSAFAGNPTATRDFLWRDEGQGKFLVLSPRPPQPQNAAAIFETPEIKPFEPNLAKGDQLSFLLRANATRTINSTTKSVGSRFKKTHVDVVMHQLKTIERSERTAKRDAIAEQAGRDWFSGVAQRSGIEVQRLEVGGYRVLRPLSRRGHNPVFAITDFSGIIKVTEPEKFLSKFFTGFGRAKAFGCGLMLIRRT